MRSFLPLNDKDTAFLLIVCSIMRFFFRNFDKTMNIPLNNGVIMD